MAILSGMETARLATPLTSGLMRSALIATVALLAAACASVEPPVRVAPRENYSFHDTRTVGPFTVERWVARGSPEVSPAGMCECITVVHMGNRTLLTLGAPQEMTARAVDATSGRDINGDRLPDLVVSTWSGGAHCCYSTTIHSVGRQVRQLLSIETGNCGPGELMDLDGNGTLELITCDDGWAYAHCSFAESPLPRVVFAYDAVRGEYRAATPRFAARFRDDIARETADARKKLAADGGKDLGADKCTVLQPALSLMYVGLVDEGRNLLRDLYRGADIEAFQKETLERVQTRPLWVAR